MAEFDPGRTINVVGDIHVGWTVQSRLDAAAADLARTNDLAVHRVFIGDLTEFSTSDEDAAAIAWLDSTGPRDSWSIVAGNHDLDSRTLAGWEAAYGKPGIWTLDFPTFRLIGLSAPDREGIRETEPQTLAPETLTYLDRQLGETSRDCVIVTHGPLMNTVIGSYFDSTMRFFATHPDEEIRAILAAHSNARAWVSGHTHSPLETTDLVKAEPVGNGHLITAINVGSVAYQGGKPTDPSEPAAQPNYSCFITVTDDAIELRVRDHLTGGWSTINGAQVTTVPFASASR